MRECLNSLGGHNTRNFGISTAADAVTNAQWNTLNARTFQKLIKSVTAYYSSVQVDQYIRAMYHLRNVENTNFYLY